MLLWRFRRSSRGVRQNSVMSDRTDKQHSCLHRLHNGSVHKLLYGDGRLEAKRLRNIPSAASRSSRWACWRWQAWQVFCSLAHTVQISNLRFVVATLCQATSQADVFVLYLWSWSLGPQKRGMIPVRSTEWGATSCVHDSLENSVNLHSVTVQVKLIIDNYTVEVFFKLWEVGQWVKCLWCMMGHFLNSVLTWYFRVQNPHRSHLWAYNGSLSFIPMR